MPAVLLYGTQGQALVTRSEREGDDDLDLPALMDRFSSDLEEDPDALIQRAADHLVLGVMLLQSAAARGVRHEALQEIQAAAFELAAQYGPATRCQDCGCTALRPCMIGGEPCGWAAPGLCSQCAERIEAKKQALDGVLG